MKISRLTINNLLSFRDEATVEFARDFNILVGPNGGGKSNLLDIITVLIRHHFLRGVSTYEGMENGRTFADIAIDRTFPHLPAVIETFGGNSLPWEVRLEAVVTEGDLDFMRKAYQNKSLLLRAFSQYRNRPVQDLSFMDEWPGLLKVEPGSVVHFTVTPTGCEPKSASAHALLRYLNHRELIYRLSMDVPELALPTAYLYFSPYRGGTEENLKANLSGQRYDDLQKEYNGPRNLDTESGSCKV